MNNNFSSSLKEIISLSREEAIRLHSDMIGTGHLLLALLRQAPGTWMRKDPALLPELQKEIEAVIATEQGSAADAGKAMVFQKRGFFSLFRRNTIGLPQGRRDSLRQGPGDALPLSRQAEKAIRVAVVVAKDRQSPAVEPEHLLLSILTDTNEKWKALLINPL
jgi:ATP-dependent Clp protease ATP-binding subunit ClpC